MANGWTRQEGREVFYTCDLLTDAGAKHLFSTRHGGVSSDCFADWNFAVGVGEKTDSEENVLANYERAAALFGLHASDVCRSYQAHTDRVLWVGEEHRGVGTVKPKFPFGVDGLVTDTKRLLLSVRSADCVPVLLYDPCRKVCGAVHAGWRGTSAGILYNAVSEMKKHGVDPADLLAAIGPCIGPCCYEVGREVYEAFCASDAELRACFTSKSGSFFLDLSAANRFWLEKAGVPASHISEAHLCTRCHPDDFFSHRRMGADRGTMSAFITV